MKFFQKAPLYGKYNMYRVGNFLFWRHEYRGFGFYVGREWISSFSFGWFTIGFVHVM